MPYLGPSVFIHPDQPVANRIRPIIKGWTRTIGKSVPRALTVDQELISVVPRVFKKAGDGAVFNALFVTVAAVKCGTCRSGTLAKIFEIFGGHGGRPFPSGKKFIASERKCHGRAYLHIGRLPESPLCLTTSLMPFVRSWGHSNSTLNLVSSHHADPRPTTRRRTDPSAPIPEILHFNSENQSL